MTPYETLIRKTLAKQGLVGKYDPRHIEAYMRSENSTLDRLSPRKFAAEVTVAAMCVDEGGIDMAERVAKSFGF